MQKSVDKQSSRQYNNTCKQRSYTNRKVRAAPFVLSEIAKVLQDLAKAQRGADRIFSDSLEEKAAMPQSENYLIERGGYQWISYPR